MPLRLFRSRNVDGANVVLVAARRRHVRHVLPRRAVPAAGPRLRPARGRARVPARHDRDGRRCRCASRARSRCASARAASLVVGLARDRRRLLLFARTPVDGDYVVDVLPPMLLIGFGAGLGFPALMPLAMSGATPQRRRARLRPGRTRPPQVGGAIGLAVLATLAAERTDTLLRATASRAPRRSTAASTSPTSSAPRSSSSRSSSLVAVPRPTAGARHGRRPRAGGSAARAALAEEVG